MHSGKSLMLFRKFNNKTQRDVAKKLRTSQQYISELEKQKHVDDELLHRILHALNSNLDEWEKFKALLPKN